MDNFVIFADHFLIPFERQIMPFKKLRMYLKSLLWIVNNYNLSTLAFGISKINHE